MKKDNSMKITLLIPTLNEIEGMKQIMPKIKKEWVDQILIVDGDSTDGTADYAKGCGYEVIVQKQKGIRHAYIEAMEHVRAILSLPSALMEILYLSLYLL